MFINSSEHHISWRSRGRAQPETRSPRSADVVSSPGLKRKKNERIWTQRVKKKVKEREKRVKESLKESLSFSLLPLTERQTVQRHHHMAKGPLAHSVAHLDDQRIGLTILGLEGELVLIIASTDGQNEKQKL